MNFTLLNFHLTLAQIHWNFKKYCQDSGIKFLNQLTPLFLILYVPSRPSWYKIPRISEKSVLRAPLILLCSEFMIHPILLLSSSTKLRSEIWIGFVNRFLFKSKFSSDRQEILLISGSFADPGC